VVVSSNLTGPILNVGNRYLPNSALKDVLRQKFKGYYERINRRKLPKFPSILVNTKGIKITHYVINQTLKNSAKSYDLIEPDIVDWIDSFEPKSVFYDIGASIGIFGLYASLKSNSIVVCFEPEAQNYGVLEMNHFLNNKKITSDFITLNCAIFDKTSLGRMYIRSHGLGTHQKICDQPKDRINSVQFESEHIQTVAKYRLDDLVKLFNLPYPKYIKIDVDGSEFQVIDGMTRILKKGTIHSIMIEVMDDKIDEMSKRLSVYGYTVKSSHQVEHYLNLFNCLFIKETGFP